MFGISARALGWGAYTRLIVWLGLLKVWWLGSEKRHLKSEHSTRSKERLRGFLKLCLGSPRTLAAFCWFSKSLREFQIQERRNKTHFSIVGVSEKCVSIFNLLQSPIQISMKMFLQNLSRDNEGAWTLGGGFAG